MVEASESIVIDAPVEDVFVFMDDPENHLTVTPSLADVRNVERLDNGGKRLDHTFRMAGISLDGELEEVERAANERMLFEMHGQLSGEIELAFEPTESGTSSPTPVATTSRGGYSGVSPGHSSAGTTNGNSRRRWRT